MSTKDDVTIGRLVAEASRDLSALLQAEIQLAKSEMTFSAKAGGIGAAMFLAAGFFAMLMTIMLAIGVALLIGTWVGVMWGFFIVAGLLLLLTALVVVIGIVLVKKVRVPKATINSAKQIPAALKPGD